MSEVARVRRHSVLGAFAFNDSFDEWRTESPVPLGGTDQVMLAVSAAGVPDLPDERFDAAAAILGRLDPQVLRREVAEAYLELYNDTWSQDEDDLDIDGFCARIRPTSVDIDEDGVTIYFNDGDLFYGHSILLMLDLDLEQTDIKLAG